MKDRGSTKRKMGTQEDDTAVADPPRKTLPLSQPLLDLFWDLAEIDQNKQIDATAKLVDALRTQVDAEKISKSESGIKSSSLDYTLNRLVRGLASNRKGVRWGFGTALTVLLEEFPEIKTSKVMSEVEQHLKIMVPADIKTIAVGQLTVYMALVNSGRMTTVSANDLRSIVDCLLKLEKEKTYLKAGASEVFLQMISKVPTEQFQKTLLPLLKDHLSKSFTELDLDGLFLLLRATQFHKKPMEAVLKHSVGTTDLLDPKHIDAICKLLYQTSTRVVHPCVHEMCEAFQARPDVFPAFWKSFVDIATPENPWKATIPFVVLPSLLKHVTEAKHLTPVLTQYFLYFLLRYAVEPKEAESESLRALHQIASKGMADILTALKTTNDQKVIFKTVQHLLSEEAVEQTSRAWSSFVSGLVHRLDADHCAKVADQLVKNIKQSTAHRGQIVKVLETILADKVKSVEDVARFNKLICFFGQEAIRPEEDAGAYSTSKDILKYLATSSQESHHRHPGQLIMAEVEKEVALKSAVMKVLVKKADDALDQRPGETKAKCESLLKSIAKLPLGPKLKPAFELFALVTTDLLVRVRPVLGEEILAEFSSIVKALQKTGKKLTDISAAGKLLGLLLTLLAVERSVFGIVEMIFKALCPFLNEDAVSVLFDLVEPVEEEDVDGEGAPIEFQSSDEEDEDMSDSEEVPIGPVELAIEKAALRQAPGIENDDAESEPDLDDEAMFKLDEVLSNMMRARKTAKNGPASSEVDVRFRALRLVHTLFCYPEADPLVILPFLRSVIRIACERVPVSQRQRQSQVMDICGKVLQCLKCRKKFDAEKIRAATSRGDVADVLNEIVEEIGKVINVRLHQQCCEAALFTQRVLMLFVGTMKRPAAVQALKEIYLPGLEKFAAKRTCTFGHLLWNALLSGLGEYGIGLLPDVTEIIFSDEEVVKEKTGDGDAEPVSVSSRKYLLIRQVQLCGIVKSVMNAQNKANANSKELEEFFRKFGQHFTEHLKVSAASEGPLKGKKLLEDTTDLARAIMLWYRKQCKHGVKLAPLNELWNFKKTSKWVDQLLEEKLAAKEVKAVRKAMLSLKMSLSDHLKRTESGEEKESTDPAAEVDTPMEE